MENKQYKHAILITAYKNFDYLIDLINYFDTSFNIYIHIDKKNNPSKEIEEKICSTKNVKFLSYRYKVNWGGINHLKACILLSNEALKDQSNLYFHLITGQDHPIKPPHIYKKFLDSPKKRDYLLYFEMPTKNWLDGGMYRVEYYNFYDLFDAKKESGKKWIVKLRNIQKKLHFKRSISPKIPKLYGGRTYWTLTRNTLQYVIDFTKEQNYLMNRMKYTLCPEEIYFHTVIMNSEYSNNVVNDDLRYIDWDSGRGGYPAILDSSDLEAILLSNKLFARKFESPSSDRLKIILKNKYRYK